MKGLGSFPSFLPLHFTIKNKMKDETLLIIEYLVFTTLGIILGISLTLLYQIQFASNDKPQEQIDVTGRWTSNDCGFYGDWIHIKVEDRDYDSALATCRHELGHEMFARKCASSNEAFNKCMEVINETG